jgi:aryl-alcohol dehydrogenase-like predicted oxidoreductase
VLQIHRFDKEVPPEETMRALHDLVLVGKVHYIGASSMWAHELATLQFIAERNGLTKITCMQNHYNLLYREEEREMNKFCRSNGIGLIAVGALLPSFPVGTYYGIHTKPAQWAPLASGHLACPYEEFGKSPRTADDLKNPRFSYGQNDADREVIIRVATVAFRRGWSMTDVALSWLNKRVTAPVIGFTSVKRIEEAIQAKGKMLTDHEEEYLEEPYMAKAIEGHV